MASGFANADYEAKGAQIGDPYRCAIILKVADPTADEIAKLKADTTLISLLEGDDAQRAALAERNLTAISLQRIPRITRAQKMDVLSSMANIAGYQAVVEAAAVFQGFFGGQVTAAGSTRPAKVLIIGAGVAGLAAIGAARSLGAEVRAFDVRPATKEQVESLGAKFLMLEFDESGDGEGGYAKIMSDEFIDAEMALFREQADEVDVIITTALIPGRPAPKLILEDMVERLKHGSVVVDLAAKKGGNCELTVPGEACVAHGVHILGYTDLASRKAATASKFFGGNVAHLLDDMVEDGEFKIDLEDEVVRAATIVFQGEPLAPPPRKPKPTPKAKVESETRNAIEEAAPRKKRRGHGQLAEPPGVFKTTVVGAILIALTALLGTHAPAEFVQHFTVFVLACFIGWQVVWSVTAALHTPLMSVTNAISGIIIVGGMLQAGTGSTGIAAVLGAVAILVASINIAGGFLVTQRMLKMFQRGPS